MAIVPDKAGIAQLDKPYASPNRSVAGVPAAASLYASEIVVDPATGDCFRAMSTGTTVWIDVHDSM
jgi:hypothetical protein